MKILKHRGLPQKSRLSWGHNITIGAKGREKKNNCLQGKKKKKRKVKSKRIKLHKFTATLELSEKFRLRLPELKCCVKHILLWNSNR